MLLAVELLLFEWKPRSFIPVAVAAIAAAMGPACWSPEPLFPFHGGIDHSDSLGLFCCVLVGLLSGVLSGLLTRFVYACEDLFQELPIHWMWWPAIGGVVVGIGGLIDPNALGLGYHNISRCCRAAPCPRRGTGAARRQGGDLGDGPRLRHLGRGVGAAPHHGRWPRRGAAPWLPAASGRLWPLLAMAAILGGTMRSPLTAIFALEVTGDTHALLPLLSPALRRTWSRCCCSSAPS